MIRRRLSHAQTRTTRPRELSGLPTESLGEAIDAVVIQGELLHTGQRLDYGWVRASRAPI